MELDQSCKTYKEISDKIAEEFKVRISPTAISKYIRKNSLQPITGVVPPGPAFIVDEEANEAYSVDLDAEEETGVTAEEEPSILESLGYDPDKFYIAGMKTWQQSADKPPLASYDIRAKKQESVISDATFESLIASIQDVKYPKHIEKAFGDKAFVFAVGDLQLGKGDGDGVEGTVKRYLDSVQKAVNKVHRYRDEIGPIHLSFVGDLIEGMVSQGGKLARRTVLSTTQQVQLLTELIIFTIKAFAPLTDALSIDSVPGNHDQAQREPVHTDPSDSWAVQALASIKLSLQEFGDPYLFGHIDFGIVAYDEDTLVRTVAGTKIVQVHGDQWSKGKHWDWLKGQVFNRKSPMVGVHVLIHGHNHTGMIEQENDMYTVRTPSFEGESNHYRRRAGSTGNPSGITFLTKDGEIYSIDFE
jgi:predicted phosphodiesterase